MEMIIQRHTSSNWVVSSAYWAPIQNRSREWSEVGAGFWRREPHHPLRELFSEMRELCSVIISSLADKISDMPVILSYQGNILYWMLFCQEKILPLCSAVKFLALVKKIVVVCRLHTHSGGLGETFLWKQLVGEFRHMPFALFQVWRKCWLQWRKLL